MTPRERRVVLGGGVAVVLIVVLSLFLRGRDPAGDDPGRREVERVQRLRGLAASVDTLRTAARNAAAAERRAAARYLSGGTSAVAAAQLSGELHALAEAAQVEVLREGVLPPETVGDASAISLQVVGRGDVPGLLDLLAGVERSRLLLSVEDLSVGGDPRDRSGGASLTITLKITGYRLGAMGGA